MGELMKRIYFRFNTWRYGRDYGCGRCHHAHHLHGPFGCRKCCCHAYRIERETEPDKQEGNSDE